MSGKIMVQRLHAQHTLNAHQAALATTASRTASRVKVRRCLFPCDLRHQHRTAQIRDPNREGRRSTVDCLLLHGGCTATCNSRFYFAEGSMDTFSYAYLKNARHFWVVCACTIYSNREICSGPRPRREYSLEQFIGASPSQLHTDFHPHFATHVSDFGQLAYHRQLWM